MDYSFKDDVELTLELLGLTKGQLAAELGVTDVTMSRWLSSASAPSQKHLQAFYEFAFGAGLRLNRINAQLFREEAESRGSMLLFHGAKSVIEGELCIDRSRASNDFGKGFYCGETLEQAAMFVAKYPSPSVYLFAFNPSRLTCKEYSVDQEWMLTIAFFRGMLREYREHPLVKRLAAQAQEADYLVAPIADNRIFQLIDEFAQGQITDVQCQHCLSATSLGRQVVFKTPAALAALAPLERCYVGKAERAGYLESRSDDLRVGIDKVKAAKRIYRREGLYIEELLS